MDEWGKRARAFRAVVSPAAAGAAALLAFGEASVAQTSEIDAFQLAVTSQKPQDALAFIEDFSSSHLIADMIELLQPEVALQVCNKLSGGPARARATCDQVKKAIALAPATGASTPPPATKTAPAPSAAAPAESASAPPATVETAPAASAVTATGPAGASTPLAAAGAASAPPDRPAPSPAIVAAGSRQIDALGAVPAERTGVASPAANDGVGAATMAIRPSTANDKAETWRSLIARFDRRPFAVSYRDREQGEMVVNYVGNVGNFVACARSFGDAPPANAAASAMDSGNDLLTTRMVIRLAEGTGGSTSISVDADHVVTLDHAMSHAPIVANVRLGGPTRTGDGRYCWSTGEMERLAQPP